MTATAVRRVLLAQPRGFCAGVEMAIKSLAWMVRSFPQPVYCYHEIVHNAAVVDRFRAAGVVFVDDLALVPPGAPLMLSAHGASPDVVAEARRRTALIVDAVCPLVSKVHHEVALRAARGYTVVYLGHDGHDEAVGTMAVAPEVVRLVQREADVERLGAISGRVAFLTQTTLSVEDSARVRAAVEQRFPGTWTPTRGDLCFATTNRQAAVRAMAGRCDAVVVVGSANSSNTVSLEHVAREAGCSRVHRVDGQGELPSDLQGTVGVTAGASAPEDLVRGVIDALAPREGIEVVEVGDEDEYFPLPPDLRRLLSEATDDRGIDASDVLAELVPGRATAPARGGI